MILSLPPFVSLCAAAGSNFPKERYCTKITTAGRHQQFTWDDSTPKTVPRPSARAGPKQRLMAINKIRLSLWKKSVYPVAGQHLRHFTNCIACFLTGQKCD
ncbi:hypothetical protein CEXT_9671 [Caerostris extrusa]|uniref:Secreted protein n=1 Tax=Caerostris extrusa TaxID=172846 RepID=A0AAV4TIE7_CAEEX|nr:hypothetical protein CEXT_9671 [Caerostris extrusa]